MAKSRKDDKGRKLREGESWRTDRRYSYRYTDIKTGKRITLYARDLQELRVKEKQIVKDLEDNILTDGTVKKMTLNTLFERYIETRELADSTRVNYISIWENRVKEEMGDIKVIQILPSHIKSFYAKLSKEGYSHSTIKTIHDMVYPALEMAVDDDIIRKNPSKKALGNYGRAPEKKTALTVIQQEKLILFVKNHNIYNTYYPMLLIMLGTGVRCGELIGLTWNDIDTKEKRVSISHQLTYRNLGDGCRFHISMPKTESGFRYIPMTQTVLKAFEEQGKINLMLGIERDVAIDGYKGFIFTTKTGRPLMPSAINNVLYNIVNAYNKEEVKMAGIKHRKAELLPKFSAHIIRHTACTRMAEQGMDIKVLQYIMGHASIDVTMQVYNHIGDMSRVEKEIEKIDLSAVNF